MIGMESFDPRISTDRSTFSVPPSGCGSMWTRSKAAMFSRRVQFEPEPLEM